MKSKFNIVILSLIVLISIFSLAYKFSQPQEIISTPNPSQVVSTPTAPHFEYSGAEGPDKWALLADQYKECASKVQTPIDIKSQEAIKSSLPPITFNYIQQKYKVTDNGHTIVYTPTQDSNITVNGKKSKLLQFHYHIPSEHEIDNKQYKMEVHFVNKSEDGNLTVVGVFITPGQANTEFDKLVNSMIKLPVHDDSNHINPANKTELLSDVIDINKLLPSNTKLYNYTGSLTTPPCTAGVNWLLFETPISVSALQISPFSDKYDNNSRPIQPTNGRIIYSNN